MLGAWLERRRQRNIAFRLLNHSTGFFLYPLREVFSALPGRLLDSPSFLFELYLLRFWVAQMTFRVLLRQHIDDDTVLRHMIPMGLGVGYKTFVLLNSPMKNGPNQLVSESMESAFKEYDLAFLQARGQGHDALGSVAVAAALCRRNGLAGSGDIEAYVAETIRGQVVEIGTMIAQDLPLP